MIDNNNFEIQVQACWDRGEDSVDDPVIASYLVEYPEELERFATWRASVTRLPLQHDQVGQRSWSRVLLMSAAACAIFLSISSAWFAGEGERVEESNSQQRQAFNLWPDTKSFDRSPTVSWEEREVLVESADTQFSITYHRSRRR